MVHFPMLRLFQLITFIFTDILQGIEIKCSWPQWLSQMPVHLVIRRSGIRFPLDLATFFFFFFFFEIAHEIISKVIFFLPLVQEGQLSVSGERMCTSSGLLRGLSLPRKRVFR